MNAAFAGLAPRSRRSKLAVLAALALAPLAADAVELRGFRGIAWGADVASLGDAREVSSNGGVRCYQRERENLLYGDAPIRAVQFCFHDGQLFLVVVESAVGQQALAAEFQGTYGPPATSAAAKAAWGDHSTRARVEIVAPPAGSPATMRIHSNEYEPRERQARGSAS